MISRFSASVCEPRYKKGSILVGPILVTDMQGCDIDVKGGHLYPSILYSSAWTSHKDACLAWNSKKPPKIDNLLS